MLLDVVFNCVFVDFGWFFFDRIGRIPLVYLTGRAVWYLADFMREHIPYIGRTLDPPHDKIDKSRRSYLQNLDDSFNR